MSTVSSGLFSHGIPYLVVGEGPPLVKVEGLTPTHEVPSGWQQRMYLSGLAPLSADFRVFWVNRKQGLEPGESMSDIAGHLAAAIEDEFGGPVFLTGESTGGSLVLQLAVDRPDLVRALVVVAAACRLEEARPADGAGAGDRSTGRGLRRRHGESGDVDDVATGAAAPSPSGRPGALGVDGPE